MFPDQLIEVLRNAKKIAILTGAGVSAESGIPTFRDALTGLWAKYDPQELATAAAFKRDPKLVWDFYEMRREIVRDAKPNPGHYALAAMQSQVPKLTLVTQNIDGLHQQAGSQDVIELHGNLARVKCFEHQHIVEKANWVADDELGVPRCPHCNSLLRPDVVWFGELLPEKALRDARDAFRNADAVFSIGTSGLVPPAAHLPLVAMEKMIPAIEVNLHETEFSSHMDYVLRGPSGKSLPALLEAVWGEKISN